MVSLYKSLKVFSSRGGVSFCKLIKKKKTIEKAKTKKLKKKKIRDKILIFVLELKYKILTKFLINLKIIKIIIIKNQKY